MRNLNYRIDSPSVFKMSFFATIALILCPILGGSAFPQETGDVPFCVPIDFSQVQPEGSDAARKRAFSLNTGEPRTVRVIYFVSNDRSFSATVEDSIKRAVRQVRSFFSDQMKAHGFSLDAINFETDDAGDPLVHRITGQHGDDHYADNTHFTVFREIRQNYDTQANIYVAFIDISRLFTQMGGRSGKIGGEASLRADFKWQTVAHELGHTFGLHHDFRDDRYVMSYGDEQDSLSTCAAQFLSVHPYFDPAITTEWTVTPDVELISSRKFPPDAENISVQFKVADTDGLHQLILFTTSPPLSWSSGFPEVASWRGLAKERNAVVEFEYERDPLAMIQTPDLEKIHVNAVDTDGNVRQTSFDLVSVSPYNYATLEGHAGGVVSVEYSPSGELLASASYDNTIRLWDILTGESLATLRHPSALETVAFSPDGKMLASGLQNGSVQLWSVATGESITTLQGHGNTVRSVTFSPDGTMLASGSSDNSVRLWRVGTGKTISKLVGHTDEVLSVLFSPNGKILASRSGDNTVRLWDVATGTSLGTLDHSRAVSSASFSPDGSTFATGSTDNNIRLWGVATGELIDTLEGHQHAVSSVLFSPDGTTLASGSLDETVRLWPVEKGKDIAILHGHDSGVERLLFSPDGTLMASAAGDRTVRLWDVITGAILATFPHSERASSLSFSPNGRFLASSDDKTVELWDLSAWVLPRAGTVTKISGDNQEGSTGGVLSNPLIVEVRDQHGEPLAGEQVTFTINAGEGSFGSGYTTRHATTGQDGRAQVTLILGPNPGPNTVRVSIAEFVLETFNAIGIGPAVVSDNARDYPTWHLPRGATLRLGKGAIGESQRAVAFSPDGRFVAVASGIGVWLYPVETTERVTLLPSDIVHSVSFSRDGRTLFSSGGLGLEGEVILWDMLTATHTRIVVNDGDRANQLLSPDGRTLAYVGGYGTLKLRDVTSGTDASILGVYGAFKNHPTCLAFSPNGTTLSSGHHDGTIRLWDMAARTITTTLEGHRRYIDSVSFSPDGGTLASASADGTVKLWDVAAGTTSVTFRGGSQPISVSFSPDGAILASGWWDGTVKLCDVTDGRITDSFIGHGDNVYSVSFSPGGSTLASASADGTVKLWDLATRNATILYGHSGPIWGMELSPDGASLVSRSGTSQGKVEVWDPGTGRMIAALGEQRCSPVRSISISPDGSTLAFGSMDSTARMWDLDKLTNFATLAHEHQVLAVSFSPNGTLLASSDRTGKVSLWDVRKEKKIRELSGLSSRVGTLVFSLDGSTLASGKNNGEIRVWDVATGATILDLRGHSSWIVSMAFSLDGSALTSGSYYEDVTHWDLATGRLTATLEGKSKQCLAFSPDGTMFATNARQNRVGIYDMSTGDVIATFEGHNHNVTSVMFTPDGRTLASGSYDGTILLWDLAPYLDPESRDPDFNGDGAVGFADFIQFASKFGLSRGDAGYDARYDLDGNGTVGFSDFVIFAGDFGRTAGQ